MTATCTSAGALAFRRAGAVLWVTTVVLAVTILHSADAQQDHYAALGVSRSASEDEIKKAFKKLARKMHPDAQRDLVTAEQKEAARKRFMAISDAYEVLGDKKKREAYDNYGGRAGSTGDERMFLRNNLFAHDFDGEQMDAATVDRALRGQLESSLLLFLWSGNVPDSVDPGLDYKRVAQRLVGSSLRIGAIKCDEMNYQICRFGLQAVNVPSIVVVPARAKVGVEHFRGKLEFQAMTEFAAKFLKEHTRRVTQVDLGSVMERCPNPAESPLLSGNSWMQPYFAETWKRSIAGEWVAKFLALEFSPCFDCTTELNIAVETLAPVVPDLLVRKVRCDFSRNCPWCERVAGKQQDRAWTIVRVMQRCYYATKRPYAFSDEHCDTPMVTVFDGKYNSGEFVQFMLGAEPSHLEVLTSLKPVKASNDSYAVLYVDSLPSTQARFLEQSAVHRHWEVLGRQVNTHRPVRGAKGFRLHIAVVDCQASGPRVCDDVNGRGRPVVALYPFGLKAKQLPPMIFDKVGGVGSMLSQLEQEMEPLHLHVLTLNTWKSKVADSMEKGRKWMILFNAGQWCPPCNHIRPNWKQTARLIQNGPAASKLSVGVVECDEQQQLCSQQGIHNYPTVYFYAKGRDRMPYNGNREAAPMASWGVDAVDSRLLRMGFQEIQQVLQRSGTVMVSFTAGQWCPPCMQLSPTYKEVANRLPNIAISETNCDDEQWVCAQFGIQGFPTIVLFHKGQRHEFQGNKFTDAVVSWAQQIVRS